MESGADARALQDLAELRSAFSGRGSVVKQRARSFQRRPRFHVKSMAINDAARLGEAAREVRAVPIKFPLHWRPLANSNLSREPEMSKLQRRRRTARPAFRRSFAMRPTFLLQRVVKRLRLTGWLDVEWKRR